MARAKVCAGLADKPEVLLLNLCAEQLTIEDADWVKVIQRARSNGWAAPGTVSPPRVIGKEHGAWDGRYTPALGQEISRDDARTLAQAFQADLDSDPSLARLCSFCERGGFLLTDSGIPNSSEEFQASS